jgi:hypothetical protein
VSTFQRKDRLVGEACTGERHRFHRGRKPGDLCLCGAARLCSQCYKAVPLAGFGPKSVKNCTACKVRYSAGTGGNGRLSVPRRDLPIDGEARYTWVPRSGNAKLGPIPTCIASAESCPPTCGFYGKGCFAEQDVLGHHWRQTQPGRRGITFDELLERVRALPPGQVWRYATAGDLPGIGEAVNVTKFGQLVRANLGRRGFTFTHKRQAWRYLHFATRSGFTINLSADTLEQADELAALEVAPVAVVLPAGEFPPYLRTPGGRKVIVCPAETRGLTCATCQLCTRAERKSIVGFVAHGQMAKTVSAIASKRRLPIAVTP